MREQFDPYGIKRVKFSTAVGRTLGYFFNHKAAQENNYRFLDVVDDLFEGFRESVDCVKAKRNNMPSPERQRLETHLEYERQQRKFKEQIQQEKLDEQAFTDAYWDDNMSNEQFQEFLDRRSKATRSQFLASIHKPSQ